MAPRARMKHERLECRPDGGSSNATVTEQRRRHGENRRPSTPSREGRREHPAWASRAIAGGAADVPEDRSRVQAATRQRSDRAAVVVDGVPRGTRRGPRRTAEQNSYTGRATLSAPCAAVADVGRRRASRSRARTWRGGANAVTKIVADPDALETSDSARALIEDRDLRRVVDDRGRASKWSRANDSGREPHSPRSQSSAADGTGRVH